MRKIIYYFDFLFGKSDHLTPPKGLSDIGTSDFKQTGNEFLKYFTQFCDLKTNERVLDVGCGIGRMAIPLTEYLDAGGSYEGFDIVSDEIAWCTRRISTKHNNFKFQKADVFNKRYNIKGKFKASEYRFPFDDESFDLIFLTSVFTHMLPADMENYFREISRVLKSGGRCLITFFLLNDEVLKLIKKGKSAIKLEYEFDVYRVLDLSTPEAIIGFDENYIFNLFSKNNLAIKNPVLYGSWCGREKFVSFQDILIAYKK